MRFRTHSVLATVVVLSIALAACRTESDATPANTVAQSTPPTSTTPTTLEPADPKIVISAPADSAPVDSTPGDSTPVDSAAAESTVTGSTPESAALPLQLSLSVHVEGYQGSPDMAPEDEARIFGAHRDAVMTVADAASEAGAVVSFEVTRQFVDRVGRFEPELLRNLIALGHDVEVHADIGGAVTLPLPRFTTMLRAQREAVDALINPQKVTHVSGICSRGPWIEAAVDAGFESTNGAVAYCMTSLDPANVPAGAEWVADCIDAAACHGPMDVTTEQRLHPFLVADSSNFLDPHAPLPEQSLVLIVSEAGSSIACLGEADTTPGCVADRADAAVIETTLAEYLELAADSGSSSSAVLSYSWSIGTAPDSDAAASIFAAFQPTVDSGEAAWISTGDLGRLARRQLEGLS